MTGICPAGPLLLTKLYHAKLSTLNVALTIYPLPPQLPTSPYLDELYRPMATLGVRVRRIRPRAALPELLAGRGPRLLHLHFFDELTQRPGASATVARTLGFAGVLAALRRRGVRIVWTAHNLAPHEARHPAWAYAAYRLVLRQSDAVIAHSQAARRMLQDRYGRLPRTAVIPHGSYIGLRGPPRDRAASRAALGLPVAGPVWLNFGTLRPYKNIEGLIEAFARLPAQERGTLLIGGQAKFPEYAARLARRAAEVPGVVLRPGFVPDAELPVWLAAADAVVLPYRELLTSGILLWALSYARPVVAPAFGPVAELVRDGHEGWLFAPGDDAALADALRRALACAERDALGASALRVAGRFAWPAIAAETVEVFRLVTRDEGRKTNAR